MFPLGAVHVMKLPGGYKVPSSIPGGYCFSVSLLFFFFLPFRLVFFFSHCSFVFGLQLSITVPLRNNVIFDDLIKV